MLLCRILELASREGKKADVYKVVGVERDAKGQDVKKRYWRLSLLIHPDKCDHPRAQDAFNAVSQAAKDLQVPSSPTPTPGHPSPPALHRDGDSKSHGHHSISIEEQCYVRMAAC